MAYPTAIQCSGVISIDEVRNWMVFANEITNYNPIGLEALVLASRLADKTAPYNLSQFYCYAIPQIACGTSYTLQYTYQNYREIIVGTTSGNVNIDYSVYNDTGGTNNQQVMIEVQYEGGGWVTVLAWTLIPVSSSIAGTVVYSYTYNTQTIITVRITKVTIIA